MLGKFASAAWIPVGMPHSPAKRARCDHDRLVFSDPAIDTIDHGGRHVAPLFAGDTVFAWSEVLATAGMSSRKDVGALRLRTVATKNRPCPDFPFKAGDEYDPAVILDLDYWVLMPR